MAAGGASAWAATASAMAADAAAATSSGARLLTVPFTSVVEYLALLRVCAQALHAPLPLPPSADAAPAAEVAAAPVGARALVVLAAAVSDFYIPPAAMATDKIQSASGGGGLALQLQSVPKRLRALASEWCPLATVCSFKLETNEHVLLAKAAASLAASGVAVVAANNLADYKQRVTLVQAEHPVLNSAAGGRLSSGPAPTVLADQITGTEAAPVPVAHVVTQVLSVGPAAADGAEGDDHRSIEGELVRALVAIHSRALEARAAGDPSETQSATALDF